MRAFLARGAVIAVSSVLIVSTAATSYAAGTQPTRTRTAHVASASDPDPLMRWKLALDLRSHPNLNPFPSYLGGDRVWSLRGSRTLQRDGDYPLLPSYSSTFGAAGLKAWHGTTPNCVKLPAVGANTTEKPVPLCSGIVPADAAFVVPAATHAPVVAWTSPFDGSVTISHDAINEVGGSCGAGVTYFVDLGTTPLATVSLASGHGTDLASISRDLNKGQTLYFVVEPQSAKGLACDMTQLQITIDAVEI
jgi:hypothetical protein